MNKLTIKRIRIKNFKGIKDFECNFNEGQTSIYGQNASGKTTLFDAFNWLLFGKDSLGKSDFSVKHIDENGNEIHFIYTEVEAVLNYNGTEIILMKRFYEKWGKKGKLKNIILGHTNDYFIDGVNKTNKEFEAKINEMIDPKIFNLVTDPFAFNELHWKEMRRILIEMCGDVQDEIVINSNPELSDFKELFLERKIDDTKKIIEEKQKLINKEFKTIPPRIDELSKIVNVEKPPEETKTILESTLKKLQSELSELQNDQAISKKQIRINMIESELLKMKNKSEEEFQAKRNQIIKRINDLGPEIYKVKDSIDIQNIRINRLQNENRADESLIKVTRDNWFIENEKTFKMDSVCPTCGQDLSANAIKNYTEVFNNEKAESLKSISEKGHRLKSQIEERNKEILKIHGDIEETQKELSDLQKEKSEKETELKNMKLEEIDTAELEIEKLSLEYQIIEIRNSKKDMVDEAQRKVDEVEAEIKIFDQQMAAYNEAQKSGSRIEELKKQEKELSAEYERHQDDLDMIEKFTRVKIDMLSEKINSNFNLVNFKMFNELINGGIEGCCVSLHNGVPWKDMNNAANINCGLDIIKSLSKFYGFSAPVWIDNRESVTNIIDIDAQIINLVVSQEHKELTVL